MSPTKRIIAQKLAQALCTKVKAVVAKEIHTQKAMMHKENGKSTVGVHPAQSKNAAKRTSALGHSNGELIVQHKPASSAGHMPIKVAHALKQEMHVLKTENEQDAHKVEIMCEMAKKKVRDDEGATTPAMRAKAVEAAIKFCHKTKEVVKHEEQVNTNKMDHMVRSDAAKYGMKVIKVDPKVHTKSSHGRVAMQPSKASVIAEEEAFHRAIGKQADFASDKNALHEAMREAEHHPLKAKSRR